MAITDSKGTELKINPDGSLSIYGLPPMLADGLGNLSMALPSVAFGTVPPNATSTAYEASHLIKGSAGVLFGLAGYNSKSSTQFILLIDSNSTTTPAANTVPAVIIAVAAASNFSYDPGRQGRAFKSGIWVANSSTGPTLTVGSADCWFDCQYV